MPREALVGHLAGGDLQRSKQGGGPVPRIIVGAPLGAARAQRQIRGGASKRLDLALLVHADHDGPLRRVQVQPDDVADLGFQLRVGGELEGLGPPGLEVVVAPDAGHGVVTDAELVGQQLGRPVGDPQVLRRWGEGGSQDLGSTVGADGLGPARARLVEEPVQAGLGVAVPLQDDGRA